MGCGKVFQVLLVIGGLVSAASGTVIAETKGLAPPVPLAVRGQVLDTAGAPLPGARVAPRTAVRSHHRPVRSQDQSSGSP